MCSWFSLTVVSISKSKNKNKTIPGNKSAQIRPGLEYRIIEYLTRAMDIPCLECKEWRLFFCPAEYIERLPPITYVYISESRNLLPSAYTYKVLHDFKHMECVYPLELQILCKLKDDNVIYLEHFQNFWTFCKDRSIMATLEVTFIIKTACLFLSVFVADNNKMIICLLVWSYPNTLLLKLIFYYNYLFYYFSIL